MLSHFNGSQEKVYGKASLHMRNSVSDLPLDFSELQHELIIACMHRCL